MKRESQLVGLAEESGLLAWMSGMSATIFAIGASAVV
jgi:hypothetical protein